MNAHEITTKLYDDIFAALKVSKFKGIEVVEVKESVYLKVIESMNLDRDEDKMPDDIFDLTLSVNQIYFTPILIKPVPDEEILEDDFQLTTLYKKDITGGCYA